MDTKLCFEKGVKQIEILDTKNMLDFVPQSNNVYVCPLCLKEFTEEKIGELSQEDAPQAKLGGSRIALTCKICNNTCGSSIDCYLINRIENYENSLFIPNTKRNIKIKFSDKEVNGQLEVNAEGEMTIRNNYNQNDPKLLDKYMKNLVEDVVISVENKTKKTDDLRFSVALLKNAYIILFSKFGYSFILNKHYDKIRAQIATPNSEILPQLWKCSTIRMIVDGIYLMNDCKGFLVVYTIQKKMTYYVMVAIPMPSVTFEEMKEYLSTIGPSKGMNLQPIIEVNYWSDSNAIDTVKEMVFE